MTAMMGIFSDYVREEIPTAADDTAVVMMLGRDSFNNPETIERILAAIPAPHSTHFDLRIVVTECIANLVHHSDCTTLIVAARQDDEQLFVQFTHIPPLPSTMHRIIESANNNALPDFEDPAYFGAGLGYPMMARLCTAITLSNDNSVLEFSFATLPEHRA